MTRGAFEQQPVELDGYAVVTDGHWLIAVPKPEGIETFDLPEERRPGVRKFVADPMDAAGSCTEDELLRWSRPTVSRCEGCVGDPAGYDDNDEPGVCSLCRDTLRRFERQPSGRIAGLLVDPNLVSLIATALGEIGSERTVQIEKCIAYGDKSCVRFRFARGVGALMPLLEGFDNPRISLDEFVKP